MLKVHAGGTDGDGLPFHLVVLGLSHQNINKLLDGKPINVDGTEVGLPLGTRIIIFAGETERSMARELESLVGPDTTVIIDPRLRD